MNSLLYESAKVYGVDISQEMNDRFETYSSLLREWNEKINLTAITDPDDIIIKHFADSLTICKYLPGGAFSMIDVGTGAGFPGLPIRIVRNDVKLTLLDSLDKRINFLKNTASAMNIDDINFVHSRAEDGGNNKEMRERYDVCTARAVASMPVLLEYCMPFVKVGGLFIAMKGSDITELDQSKRALKEFGGEIISHDEFELFGENGKRNVIVVKKIRQISTKYPRKAGKPSKEPII